MGIDTEIDLSFAAALGAVILSFGSILAILNAFRVIRKIASKQVPVAFHFFAQSKRIKICFIVLQLIALISLGIAAFEITIALFIAWAFLISVGFLLLCYFIYALFAFADKDSVLTKMVATCKRAFRAKKHERVLELYDSLFEALALSVKKGDFIFSQKIIQEILLIVEEFVKRISLEEPQYATGLLDRADYICVHTAKRFEWIFGLTLKEGQEPVSEAILSAFGKMSLYFARFLPDLIHIPLSHLERCAGVALARDFDELHMRSTAILSEVVKNCIMLSKEQNISFKETILLVLSHLEESVNKAFKKNKSINPALLMQPFAEIGELIANPQYSNFPDRDEVFERLQRILQSLSALDVVMQRRS